MIEAGGLLEGAELEAENIFKEAYFGNWGLI